MGRALLIGTVCVIALRVAGLTQTTDESFQVDTGEVTNDELSGEDASSTDSITDEASFDEDFSENPPPHAPGTRPDRPLSPLKSREQSGYAPSPPPARLETIPDRTGEKLWRFSPLFGAGITYGDNIFISHTNRVSDVVLSLDSNQSNHAFRDNRADGGLVFRL